MNVVHLITIEEVEKKQIETGNRYKFIPLTHVTSAESIKKKKEKREDDLFSSLTSPEAIYFHIYYERP